ncbi:plasmid replication protein RepC [Roseivivax sp. CAU 1761]
MHYTPISPFQRPMTRAHLAPSDPAASLAVDKWALHRDLTRARRAFGLGERELTVLQGLLSFHPDRDLAADRGSVVFPSNKALAERLNGMACSTMRRHLARLVALGFLARRDSPNGKRYCRRNAGGDVAFGFDLSPLPRRAAEIRQAAEAVDAAEERLRSLREVVSLMRRDLAAVATLGATERPGLALWDELSDRAALAARALRRKLPEGDLLDLKSDLLGLLDLARDVLEGPSRCKTVNLSTSESRIEQHHQNSDKEDPESEGCDGNAGHREENAEGEARGLPHVPLPLVLSCCSEIQVFAQEPIRHWHQLHELAANLRAGMGIDDATWLQAQRSMGPAQAAIVVAAILQRFGQIRSPGAYLRALSAKAAARQFGCGPMLLALTRVAEAA